MTDPINHNTREPHQPTFAIIVEGDVNVSTATIDDSKDINYQVRLDRLGPGNVEFKLILDGRPCGTLPFDNLVKAATRIDPDHAVGSEKQIQKLRQEVSEARAEKFDWQAKAEQLEERVQGLEARLVDPDEKPLRRAAEVLAERNRHIAQLEEKIRAYEESTKA